MSILNSREKNLNNVVNRSFMTLGGGSRSGEKTAKVERKASVGFVKSRDKREEAMDWEADTKDVLEQLLRDDVTVLVILLLKLS